MTGRRRAVRRDGNHSPIARAFTDAGCTVWDTSACGTVGAPDIVVGFRGRTRLIEIKNPDTQYGRAGLSGPQNAFNRDWNGEPMWCVDSIDGVEVLVRAWATESTKG